jgi:hypothetical protein
MALVGNGTHDNQPRGVSLLLREQLRHIGFDIMRAKCKVTTKRIRETDSDSDSDRVPVSLTRTFDSDTTYSQHPSPITGGQIRVH